MKSCSLKRNRNPLIGNYKSFKTLWIDLNLTMMPKFRGISRFLLYSSPIISLDWCLMFSCWRQHITKSWIYHWNMDVSRITFGNLRWNAPAHTDEQRIFAYIIDEKWMRPRMKVLKPLKQHVIPMEPMEWQCELP